MGKHRSKQQLKRAEFTEASSPTTSKRRRREKLVELESEQRESESPLLLPSSDSSRKINVPSASGANSDPPISSTSEDGNKKNYYVFLSFRGPDTRKGFVDHLYQRLKAVGLPLHPNFVFRDDEDLTFGEKIGENLISVIERSKVSIPVISENYAASKWCLRELIHIMKCKESRGQIVLPVLYKVTTDDVKHMQGKFGEAFESSMGRFEEDVKQQGLLALREAVALRVFELEKLADGHEGELVNALVEIILREQQYDVQPHLPVNLVAIEHRVAEVMELMDLACPDTRIIGIWGIGGIGKTTLATIIYKMLFDKFKCRSFLKDIRETIYHKGVEHVQSLLLSDIRKGPKSTVRDPVTGINMIRFSCEKEKVLILLDDVDCRDHLNNLIGGCKFSLGSRIIFTSRHKAINCQDKALLESTYWYELQKMNIQNSLLLFSMHAFEEKSPPKQLATLSRDIVAVIGGLPLALTVIGSHLKGKKDQGIWGEMLEKLRNAPDEMVVQHLRDRAAMGKHRSKQRPKLVRDTDALSPTLSKRPRPDVLEELPLLPPSSDSLEKVNVPSASGANSDPSASSTSVNGNNYYVFLSFRGPDTCKCFVDHLYQRLKAVGLPFHPNFVFRDDEDLLFSKKNGENLINAIEHSKVSIPVISENYAASKWCLRELIHIMKCKESRGQIVLPVLYKVTTADVKHMQGKFGEAFESSMGRFEEDVKQQGLLAIREAVDLRVFESEKFADGREGELVNELVEIILREQQYDLQPHLPVNLVAIEHCVAEVMELMDLACLNTRIIGIWGIGGIGKTTLATIIYKMLFDKFKCRSFLKDIRETINRKGVEHVQSLLLSDIRKGPKSTVRDPVTGINMIRFSCEKEKVLILLDDVDCRDHLDNLIGGCKFSLGSRIIFTSRHKAINCQDKALLESTYWYELQKMNIQNSLLLFSMHAFEEKSPPKQLATLSRDIVAVIGGLPLALTVIGSHLKGKKDQGIWGEMLEKLRNTPDEMVVQHLRISYDLLECIEKQMFIDISCFFIGIDESIAPYLWDCKLYPRIRLKVLINRSLIYIDDDNELRMHDELRDLGRAITRPANKKLWDCSRLWDGEAMIVLSRKEENENIEALRLDERGSREFMERESFKRMPNLKFLHVKDVDFDGDFKGSLTKLRWLKWERCHDCFEAIDLHLEKLVILDLSGDYNSGNHISENWRGWSSIKMERIKVLNLSWCLRLKSTPNLSAFKNLEMLILESCAYLEEIDPSIGDVKCLVVLNMSRCKGLKKLPEQLGELENLEVLVVDETQIKEIPPCIGSLKKLKTLSAKHCLQPIGVRSSIVCPVSLSLAKYYKLQVIPSSIGKLQELIVLDLSYTGIKELPESVKELNKLKILRICGSRMERLPISIGKLQSLQEVNADGCSDLEGQIHVDKGGFSSLKTLSLAFTKFSSLPENLDQLPSLEHLELLNCYELQSLPKPPFSLSSLRLTCWSNELPSLSHLKHLKELTLWYCMSLQSIPELPSCIRTLNVEGCPKLERLPNLSNLEFLLELGLVECLGLKKLDGLKALKSLRELSLSKNQLGDFDENADELHAMEGLEKLGSLEVVDISGRKHIQVLDLSKSEHLKVLNVRGCKSLVEICCPSKFLEHFDRYGCESLKKFPNFFPPDRA